VSPVLEPCLERLMSGRSPVVLTWQWCKSAAELCELVAMSVVSSMLPFCRVELFCAWQQADACCACWTVQHMVVTERSSACNVAGTWTQTCCVVLCLTWC
jgi:hypothetical protein